MADCAFCVRPVDLDDDETYHEVKSWVNGPKLDGPKLREQTGLVAHKACIDKVIAGQAADQPDLFDGSAFGWTNSERCEENAVKGTGTGVCDAMLDAFGNCPNASNHVDEQ